MTKPTKQSKWWEKKRLEMNFHLKRLLTNFGADEIEADRIIFEVNKYTEKVLSTELQKARVEALDEALEAIKTEATDNYVTGHKEEWFGKVRQKIEELKLNTHKPR